MMRFAELAAPWFDPAEIIELHHDGKIDAPSGTAMATAERMAGASPTGPPTPRRGTARARPRRHRPGPASPSTPCGSAAWSPTRRCCSAPRARPCRIRHDSYDRASFMPGVLLAVKQVSESTRGHRRPGPAAASSFAIARPEASDGDAVEAKKRVTGLVP